MKKVMIPILIVLFVCALTACAGKNVQKEDTAMNSSEQVTTVHASKTLVLYFSYSGNTEKVANWIGEYTGLEVIRLEPEDPYPADYNECVKRVEAEHPANARPELATKLDDLDEYDTVIIGWPCWNYSCPMLILTMLEQYDFSEKTIIPFTTHGGSGFAKSLEEMKASCPNAIYEKGLAVYEKDVDNSYDQVIEWLNGYGFHEKSNQNMESLEETDSMSTVNGENTGIGQKHISILVGEQEFSAVLYDNDATKELINRMPINVDMSELNGNEKYHYFLESIPTDSQKLDEVHAGDIMLYGSDCLVLFYDTFSTSYSYTRLGYVENSEGLKDALGNGNVSVTFKLAN